MHEKIPLAMLTDSACLFNVPIRSSQTLECRLMLDLEASREGYDDGDINDVG